MKVREGDVIGLKGERFGTVSFLVTQDKFLVDLYPEDPAAPTPESPEQVWTDISQVASIR